MSKRFDLASLRTLPAHVEALQMLVERCIDDACKKELIVIAGCCGAISPQDGFLLVTANQVESA